MAVVYSFVKLTKLGEKTKQTYVFELVMLLLVGLSHGSMLKTVLCIFLYIFWLWGKVYWLGLQTHLSIYQVKKYDGGMHHAESKGMRQRKKKHNGRDNEVK